MQTNLSFQKGDLEPIVKRLLPGGRRLTFTVPWVFEDHFEEIASQIPRDTTIVDWDYDLSDDRVRSLQSRLKRYQRSGHPVWFMPSCDFGITSGAPVETQAGVVLSQVQLALDAGARGIVYFMGSHWSPHVDETSHYLNS